MRVSRRTGVLAAAVALASGLALAACGGGGPATTTTSTGVTTTTTPGSATNLTVTPGVRAALLAAGASAHDLPVADFRGLTRGLTFYAYDRTDGRYWAGAQLVASPHAEEAAVVLQDDGAYDLFSSPNARRWVAFEDGLGTVRGTHCAVVVPAAVRMVWGWSLTTPCGGPAGV